MLVYNVANDTGITSEAAKEMYYDNLALSEQQSKLNARSKTLKSKSGFYVDSRDYISKGYPNCLGKKISLFIFGENSNDKVLVIRPNLGKNVMRQFDALEKLKNLCLCSNVHDALELWEREFIEADIPYKRKYQFSCAGRHKETQVVCGNVVPILQKMISAFERPGIETQKVLSIVRVETGTNEGLAKNNEYFGAIKTTAKISQFRTKQPCLGDKVAMDLGYGILLGSVVEKCKSGRYVCNFVDQSKVSLTKKAVKDAR